MKIFDYLIANVPKAGLDNSSSASGDFLPWPVVLLALFVFSLLVASFAGWAFVLISKALGRPLPLSDEHHQSPPWGLSDILIAIATWFVCQIFAQVILVMLGYRAAMLADPTPLALIAIVQAFALLAVLLATGWMILRFGRVANNIGWSVKRIGHDLCLGIATFVLAAPILYGLMIVATLATKREYSHPLFEAFTSDPINILYALWIAVIVAPLMEEFAFRVLLQGFLQAMADGRPINAVAVLFGRGQTTKSEFPSASIETFGESTGPKSEPIQGSEPDTAAALSPQDVYSANINSAVATTDSPRQYPLELPARSRPWWPVLVSGTLFGLAHFEYGASWIPLIFFGVVLGWLYRQTNRIWPSLMAHVMCNSIAVCGATVETFYGNGVTN